MTSPEEQAARDALSIMDSVALSTLIATLAGWLPSLGALLTVVWTMIRIWETDTVRRLTGREPTKADND